jgi:iron complex outermembrane receptor protein
MALQRPASSADHAAETSSNLGSMSIEELLNVTVTSVARRSEKLAGSPAAVHVLTQEEIRRSGATSIPQALRLVPGLNVAQVNAHEWAISSRGFNDIFANKLLVLIDGRSVYTPLFSGVYWDVQDVLLEDIDRIEVIRGPGAALWGANAVNGVINIISKPAAETRGTLVTAGGGTEERAFGSVRHGGKVGSDLHYRVYGKYFNRDDSASLGGGEANDSWEMGRAGFRVDYEPPGNDRFTLQGDIYRGDKDQLYRRLMPIAPFATYDSRSQEKLAGGNVIGRWTHRVSDVSEFTLQTYYDRTEREASIFADYRDTFDIDFQHRFPIGERQVIVWGGGYRRMNDSTKSTFDIELDPESRRTDLFSAFLQDEIALVPKRLTLTLGSKFEHNDYSGFELQPSARLLWTPAERHAVWASVSRAMRTPSRAEQDIILRQGPAYPANSFFPGSPSAVFATQGNSKFESEELIAYEAGYRVQPHDRLSLDFAGFYNEYEGLRSFTPADPAFDPFSTPPRVAGRAFNGLDGETYGGEISAMWRAADWWRLRAHYALLFAQVHQRPGGIDSAAELSNEGMSPQNQVLIRSSMDVTRNVEFDATVRYVDSLPGLNIDSYLALDLRLAWQPSENVELSVVGQNLLNRRHREFSPTVIPAQTTEIEAGVYGKVTIRF